MQQQTAFIRTFLVFIFGIIFLGQGMLFAQQEPQFTHNMFNYSFVNPGHFGMEDAISVTGIYRQQWQGFKDEDGNKVAPETFSATIDAPIKFLRGGVGLGILQDKIGFFKDLGIRLGYSYHIPVGNGKIGIGTNASFLNRSTDFSKFDPIDESDHSIASGSEAKVLFTDCSLGAFYKTQKFYLSLSSTQLVESEKALNKEGTNNSYYKQKRHYYLGSGYSFPWKGNPTYIVTPSVFFKTDAATIQTDFNVMVAMNRKIWAGVTYRLEEAVGVMFGWTVQDIEIGYSYDVPLSRVAMAGSHEVMVRYRFKLEREKTKSGYRNTRFL